MVVFIPIVVLAAVMYFTEPKNDGYFCYSDSEKSYCLEQEVSEKDFK